jgi:hypothetical protein
LFHNQSVETQNSATPLSLIAEPPLQDPIRKGGVRSASSICSHFRYCHARYQVVGQCCLPQRHPCRASPLLSAAPRGSVRLCRRLLREIETHEQERQHPDNEEYYAQSCDPVWPHNATPLSLSQFKADKCFTSTTAYSRPVRKE